MKKLLFITVFMMVSPPLTAQKTMRKIVEAGTISAVEIDASQAYKLIVKTTASRTIDISAALEGEYKDDLTINTQKEAEHFKIGTAFRPSFKHPNDKLSAHKVISVLLVVELPENLNLIILGSDTHVSLSGAYKTIKAHTTDGNFVINNAKGDGEIRNLRGDIFVSNYSGTIVPHSKYGKISGRNTAKDETSLALKTVNGNIYIDKPK